MISPASASPSPRAPVFLIWERAMCPVTIETMMRVIPPTPIRWPKGARIAHTRLTTASVFFCPAAIGGAGVVGTAVAGAISWPTTRVDDGGGGSSVGGVLITRDSLLGSNRHGRWRRRWECPRVRGREGEDEDEERDIREHEKEEESDRDIARDEAGQRQALAGLARSLDLAPGHVAGDHGNDAAEAPGAQDGRCSERGADDRPRVVWPRYMGCSRWRRVRWQRRGRRHATSLGIRGLPTIDPVAVTQEDAIKRRLRAVPEGPGVYLFRDVRTQVIYVGKALRLRARLRSYFTPGYAETARVSELVRKIHDFEFVTTANEVEALVLENNLIKNYKPRFNIRLKDDKNYLYLKLPVTEEYPRVHYSRRVLKDGALYFGPYTSAQSLRGTVKSIRQLLPFRTCSDEIFKQGKVCLDFHIKRCPGPCERRISAEDYKARIHEVALFMEGRSDVLVNELNDRMDAAAGRLDFENAARYRDQLQSIERIADRQKVVVQGRDDQDLVAYARTADQVFVEVAYVRQGKMVGHDGHALEGAGEATEPELLRGFLLQYYESATHVPRTVIVPGPVEEPDLLTSWLTLKRGGPVTIEVPQRGRKRALVTQLAETAAQELEQL